MVRENADNHRFVLFHQHQDYLHFGLRGFKGLWNVIFYCSWVDIVWPPCFTSFQVRLLQCKKNKLDCRVQRIHSSTRIYEYKMGKDEWFFWHGRPARRVITKNQTSRNAQFLYHTLSLWNFKFLPDQTKFYWTKYMTRWNNMLFFSHFKILFNSSIPVMVFGLFLCIGHTRYQAGIQF